MTPNDIDLPVPAQSTVGGQDDAKRALAESQAANTASNAIIEESAKWLGIVAKFRDDNHYTEKFRAIIRGTHHGTA